MRQDSIYQPPDTECPPFESISPTELRQRYARDEICVLAVGWFYYYLGSLLLGLIGLVCWLHFSFQFEPFLLSNILCLLAGSLFILIGYGIRNFDAWARAPSIVAGYVAMFLFPVGTLAGGVCVYLLHSHAIKEIFSDRYRNAYAVAHEGLPRFGWLGLTLGFLTGLSLWAVAFFFGEWVRLT